MEIVTYRQEYSEDHRKPRLFFGPGLPPAGQREYHIRKVDNMRGETMRHVIVAIFSVTLLAQDANKGWVDYDDLDEVERLKERPGNYHCLTAVVQFLENVHAVRPNYRECAFPLQLDSRTYEDVEQIEKALDERATAGRRPKNKLRQFNIRIRSLSIHDAEAFVNSPHYKRLHSLTTKRYDMVRKRHPGQGVVVLVYADLESLQSPKVERADDDPLILYFVQDRRHWRVAWFENP
jgi:hypothetical protein